MNFEPKLSSKTDQCCKTNPPSCKSCMRLEDKVGGMWPTMYTSQNAAVRALSISTHSFAANPRSANSDRRICCALKHLFFEIKPVGFLPLIDNYTNLCRTLPCRTRKKQMCCKGPRFSNLIQSKINLQEEKSRSEQLKILSAWQNTMSQGDRP